MWRWVRVKMGFKFNSHPCFRRHGIWKKMMAHLSLIIIQLKSSQVWCIVGIVNPFYASAFRQYPISIKRYSTLKLLSILWQGTSMASCAFLNVARNEPFHYFYKFKIINYKVHIYVMIPMFGIGWILLPLPSSISSRDSECSCRISRHRDILKALYSLV